jgi:alkylated DNA repair dioxygenase AlkB
MLTGGQIDLPDGELVFLPRADLGGDPDTLFDLLRAEIAWREEQITLFGRRYWQPRLLAWYGDAGASYRYSGKLHEPLPWSPHLLALRDRVEHLADARFNSVLANLYRDHNDSMGLHADDEPELGERPVIASLSLGEERVFRLKHRSRRDLRPLRLALPSGSLLIMRGDTQRYWKHEVPKSRHPCGPRINLTFRLVHPAAHGDRSRRAQ